MNRRFRTFASFRGLTLTLLSVAGFSGSARAENYCAAWTEYLTDVPPGLMTKFSPPRIKGDPNASRYKGSLKTVRTRDIACDSSNGCGFAGETHSLTGGMKVSNDLMTSLPKDFSKAMKRFTERVNAYREYAKKRKDSATLDAKQKKLLEEVALASLKGREIVVNDGLAKGCFPAYELALTTRAREASAEVRKVTAQLENAVKAAERMPASASKASDAPVEQPTTDEAPPAK